MSDEVQKAAIHRTEITDGDSAMNKLSKDGCWFQFDDERVFPVDRRHAVEGSFGSPEDFHSAYMLVYLREKDADSLMGEVIPPVSMVDMLQRKHANERPLGGTNGYRAGLYGGTSIRRRDGGLGLDTSNYFNI